MAAAAALGKPREFCFCSTMRSTILTAKRANALRRAMTEPEVMLWSRLRRRLPEQPVFRRQHALGPFILDFYCPAALLAVEVDGATHGTKTQADYDARRDRWLGERGVRVIRIAASEVFLNLAAVADRVRLTAAAMVLERRREGDHGA